MDQLSNSLVDKLDYSHLNSSIKVNKNNFNSTTMLTIKNNNTNNNTNNQMQLNASTNNISTLDSIVLSSKCSEAPKRLCLVCGDIASGFHYGVASCEACKAFFKRTIQGNIEYSCPAQSDCEINKRRRKACQACRFQKCLRMGMLKEGVRLDRVRGGRQKYRRNDSPYLVNAINCNTNTNSTSNNIYINTLNNMRTGQLNPLITILLNCEPDPIVAKNGNECLNNNNSDDYDDHDNLIDCKPFNMISNQKMISELSRLVDKELVSTIVWAKQIPGFTDLELNDQMRLLQSTWAEILALSISYRTQVTFNNSNSSSSSSNNNNNNSISTTLNANSSNSITSISTSNNLTSSSSSSSKTNCFTPTKLVFANDFIMDQCHAIECGAEEMFGYCLQLQKRITPLAISKQEYVLLKALLLANVDIELEDYESVEKLRNNVLNALQEAVTQSKSPFNALQHLNELLLCLPLIRQIDFIIRKFWNQVRLDNKVSMNKLFVEMLESNIAFK